MAFFTPWYFRVIGPQDDPVGSSQFSPRHSIGGAETVDGYDEIKSILFNSTWSYVVAAREVVAQYVPQGTSTWPSYIYQTTSAAYVDACVLTFDMSEAREGLEAFVDFGHSAGGGAVVAEVQVTIRRRDTAAILVTGSTTTANVRATASIALAGITQTACYAEIDIKATGGGTATLYGIQLYSDEATP